MGYVHTEVEIHRSLQDVFHYVDDIHHVHGHMHDMSGHLQLEILSPNDRGLGATYRWTGRILGVPVRFTEQVTAWVENREKRYQAISGAVFSLHHRLEETPDGTRISSDLNYELPLGGLGRFLDRWVLGGYVRRGFGRVMQGLKADVEAS